MKKKQKAYVVYKKNKNNKQKNKTFIDHIESMQIKQAKKEFEKNPEDEATRYIELFEFKIDLKDKRAYLLSDIDQENSQDSNPYYFEEIPAHERERSDPSRFIQNIVTEESLKHGNDGEYNKVGNDWARKNNR